jgi:hypothetical protein
VVLDDLDELLQTTRAKIVTSRTALRTALLSSAARCALRAASLLHGRCEAYAGTLVLHGARGRITREGLSAFLSSSISSECSTHRTDLARRTLFENIT